MTYTFGNHPSSCMAPDPPAFSWIKNTGGLLPMAAPVQITMM